MDDAEDPVLLPCAFDQYLALVRGHRERLLRQDVLAHVESRPDHREVTHRRSPLYYGVHLREPGNLLEGAAAAESAYVPLAGDALGQTRVPIDDADDIEAAVRRHCRQMAMQADPA